MRLAMLMVMQASAPVAGPPLPPDMLPKAKPPIAKSCDMATSDIVVCGRSADANRLKPVGADRYAEKPVRAATTIGKVGVSAEAEQAQMPTNGMVSRRAMVRFRIPF